MNSLNSKNQTILFLDIDGVMNDGSVMSCPPYNTEEMTKEFIGWSIEPVNQLYRVLNETNCSVVISSSWRKLMPFELFNEMFDLYGLPKVVIDMTPARFSDGVRGGEIRSWINEHQPKRFAIVDDDTDMLEEQMPFFVKTDCMVGLTKEQADQLIEILRD